MEVRFNVPEDLVRRIEYIPEYVLPEVLINVFRAGVEKMTKPNTEGQAREIILEQVLTSVLDTVKSLQAGDVILSPAHSVNDVKPTQQETDAYIQQAKELKVEPTLQIEDDDDDLGELLGMMK